jgi:hypothetical protein
MVVFFAASLASALFYFITPASTPWLHQTIGQVAVSFVALAVLCSFMFTYVPTTSRLNRKFAVPRAIRRIALLGFFVSAITFSFFGFITATSHNVHVSRAILLEFYHAFPEGNFLFGVFGLAFFLSSSLCLMAYFLDRGTDRAFNDTLRFFVFPALMVFELFLFLVDTKEMPIHVTMFLASTPLADVLTNWFVFVVSSGLFFIGLAHKKLGF